ncbi:MAG TPA: rhamnulokinase family protein [Rhodothermales bacterium]|nr:rhamnulokinase family protein [Rhodothermales bacterium]
MNSYIAVDLGASNGRIIVGRLDGDSIALEEAYRFSTPSIETDGHLRWDLDALTAGIKEGVDRAIRTAPEAKSVSVDSWAVDYVNLDSKGRPLGRPYCYRDPRNEGMIDQAFRTISRERLYEITGIQYLPFNTLFQILADQAYEPDGQQDVSNRLLIADYFNHILGGRPVIDLSMASTTHMVDARTQDWSDEILAAFGIGRSTLPEIVPSGTVIGESADHPGFKVIATCSHDTGAAVTAVPADEDTSDWAYISSGTWSLIGLELEDPILSMEAMKAGFTNEIGLDGRIRFLKNLSGLWILQECLREWRTTRPGLSWAELAEQATAVDVGTHRIDVDDPRFMAPGGMLARLSAYCAEVDIPFPAEPGPVARLLLESLASAYADAANLVEQVSGRQIEVLHIVGGGAQNELLCQLAANATGCRVTAGPVEATAIGNLLVQARTLGDLPHGVSIREVVRRSFAPKTYNPQ